MFIKQHEYVCATTTFPKICPKIQPSEWTLGAQFFGLWSAEAGVTVYSLVSSTLVLFTDELEEALAQVVQVKDFDV